MNPFDQFDAEASGASAEANPFDQFDSKGNKAIYQADGTRKEVA